MNQIPKLAGNVFNRSGKSKNSQLLKRAVGAAIFVSKTRLTVAIKKKLLKKLNEEEEKEEKE